MKFGRQSYFDIISGKRTGFFARCCRVGLSVLEIPYGMLVRIRNFMYDKGLWKIERLSVPVVSVGNLTVGGTGKTPFVAWLAQKYLDEGKFPAIVSRGYHADETGWNDEAKELKMLLPDVPQAFSKNRFKSAIELLKQYNGENGTRKIDVVILDDGFQHRQLYRDHDILLIDATNPFGYNRMTPRGLLREPISGLKRADTVVLSRTETAGAAKKSELQGIVSHFAPDATWAEMQCRPKYLFFPTGEKKDIAELAGHKVLAFCGLGNPDFFFQTLAGCGCIITERLVFPDHHHYTNDDLKIVLNSSELKSTQYVVCSLKDLVKIVKLPSVDAGICALVVESSVSGLNDNIYLTEDDNTV